MLWARVLQNAAANRFSTFRREGVQTGYAVTAGRTLLLTRVLYSGDAASITWNFGYADSDLGISAAADGANPVFLDAEDAGVGSVLRVAGANSNFAVNVYYEVPAGKFARLSTGLGTGSLFVQMYGHEVA
jgi:hypothetical protein